MSKKKYYAVAKGRKPGIYNEWHGTRGAETQITGFSGAVYRGFSSHTEAVNWLNRVSSDTATDLKHKFSGSNNLEESGNDRENKPILEPGPPHQFQPLAGNIIIYTDGGCLQNPGPGGYGVVLLAGDRRKELSGGYARTTNNRMELMACIKGLEALRRKSSIIIYSDSQYVVKGIQKGWAKRWRANNWQRNDKEKARNPDLWARLLDLCNQHDVKFVWLKGHDGIRENERCDELSYEMARGNDLLPDDGFGSCR